MHGTPQFQTRLASPIVRSSLVRRNTARTLFHELVHSTGHKSRLHREQFDNPVRFGAESYSKEELVAELGSSMLCGVSGISPAYSITPLPISNPGLISFVVISA